MKNNILLVIVWLAGVFLGLLVMSTHHNCPRQNEVFFDIVYTDTTTETKFEDNLRLEITTINTYTIGKLKDIDNYSFFDDDERRVTVSINLLSIIADTTCYTKKDCNET